MHFEDGCVQLCNPAFKSVLRQGEKKPVYFDFWMGFFFVPQQGSPSKGFLSEVAPIPAENSLLGAPRGDFGSECFVFGAEHATAFSAAAFSASSLHLGAKSSGTGRKN